MAAGQGPLAVVGAELDRLAIIGWFSDHGKGPVDAVAVLDQVDQQLDHDPAAGCGGRHRLGPSLTLAQPGRAGLHEPLEMLVAGDAALARVVHDHLDRPGTLDAVRVAALHGPDEGAHRIGQG